uniref:legumain n=1 Tax=Cuerna arida TaxID=1464854 RepID=A0A1B6H275_9HEMI
MWRALLLVSVALPAALSSPLDVEDKGQVWAVLVAGSNTYDNYRHQADICHAYQIFHRHGVPDSNIIVMMYDDIANNPDNPKKGKIFNKPGGPNVYGPKAVPKDYTGDAVTPKNFVHVLTGNHEAVKGVGSGKVLKSGPNDHVFVNFVDHGAPGLIGFPNDVMHADDLIQALKTMNKQKMYKKLVFYMEACESGSMFDKLLPKNIEIYATTAANPHESSYACYWSDELSTYLGDEYSISWMEDTDAEEKHKTFSSETLLKQYNNVVNRVKDSHPSMYGETIIDKDHVQDFLGKSKQKVTFYSESSSELEPITDAVPSRDVALHVLTKKIALAETADQKEELQKKKDYLIKGRKDVDQIFSRILSHVTNLEIDEIKNIETSRQEINLEMMPCYKTLVKAFSEKCVNIHKNMYTFSHLYKLANMCALQYSSTDVLKAFSAECGSLHQGMVNVN